MRIVRPVMLGAGLTLDDSNVPQDHPAWNGAANYDIGALVTNGTNDFESVQNGNVGHMTDDPAWWVDLGASNRFAMFDQYNGTQTQNPDTIEVEVSASGRVNEVALLNLSGSSVDITMSTAADGVIFDETFDLVSASGINNWYEYFFEPIVRKSDLVVSGLPNYANPSFSVIVHQPSGMAKVGVAIFGRSREIGDVVYGAKTGIQDYSRKETDEFGNFKVLKRAYAKRGSYKLVVDNARIDELSSMLADYRAEPILWIGANEYVSTWIYGFYRDFSVEITFPNQSYLNLEIEGLT